MSHGLQSEPQTSYTAVLPNPARNLSILAVEDSKISLQWLPPVNSLLTEYNIRYKPVVRRWGGADHVQDAKEGDLSRPWSEVMVVPRNSTSFILADLPPGEDGRLSVTTFPRIVQTMPRPPARPHTARTAQWSAEQSRILCQFRGKIPRRPRTAPHAPSEMPENNRRCPQKMPSVSSTCVGDEERVLR